MTTFTKKNNWWADAYNFAEDRERADRRKIGVKSRHQFRGFLCNKCNNVWETSYCATAKRTQLYKYNDFPSYGLERRECFPCAMK